MWEHYRKTFKGMQVLIALVAVAVYVFFGRQWRMAGTFFLVMQLSAVIGAVWAARIQAFVHRDSGRMLRAPRP